MTTLVVTNDFPPREGGIQSYVQGYVEGFDPADVVVYASRWEGWEDFDARQPYPIHRYRSSLMLPTPDVGREAVRIAQQHGCDSVWFGAMAPLGALAGRLKRQSGVRRAVATTHGHEVGWAAIPGARASLKRIARDLDVVTYLGEYTRERLEPIIGSRTQLHRLPGGVDIHHYRPELDASELRARLGLADRPVVVCVSRLKPRKGQDTLIRCLPQIRQAVPDAALLLVGGGSYEPTLRSLVRDLGLERDVVLTGSVPADQLALHYLCGDVFAMPCRTRRGGLDVEGLGLVYLEASAVGLPVVAGDSGGAPDAVVDGVTGLVVDGRDEAAVAAAISSLLSDSSAARGMGKAGREWVELEWRWERLRACLAEMLKG